MIINAAIFNKASMKVYTDRRHHLIIQNNPGVDFKHKDSIQGFITDTGVFLDRQQAYDYAIKCGQLEERKIIGSVLTSEDLW